MIQAFVSVFYQDQPTMMYSAIFFDVGNTLVFPDWDRTLSSLTEKGLVPTRQHLNEAERAAKLALDHDTIGSGLVR